MNTTIETLRVIILARHTGGGGTQIEVLTG